MTKTEFVSAFGLSEQCYELFLAHVRRQLSKLFEDLEEVPHLTAQNRWEDAGRNVHVRVQGEINRRDIRHEIGGEVVWLTRLGAFRGGMWRRPEPKQDWEYLMEARQAFRLGNYAECLKLCNWVGLAYSDKPSFRAMRRIAEKRLPARR